MQSFLRTRYAPHLLYADCKEFNVEQERDNRSITDIFTELGEALERCSKSGCKDCAEPESKPKIAAESEPKPEVAAKPESEPAVVNEPESEPETEQPLVESSTDLSAEFAMKLVPSSPAAVRVPLPLRSPGVYDPLQILLEATCSQEFRFLMVQSTIGPVFSGEDLPRHVTCLFRGTINPSRLFTEASSTSTTLVQP